MVMNGYVVEGEATLDAMVASSVASPSTTYPFMTMASSVVSPSKTYPFMTMASSVASPSTTYGETTLDAMVMNG
jgi:hypothetical protein